jgi:hypothetical protein
MRYLRDLDIDAHLFMYIGEYEHFKPEKDTYNIERYKDYIHTLSLRPSVKGLLLLNEKKIKEELKGYDFFIGCDMAPAMFLKLGMKLDIFIPYGDVMEFTVKSNLRYKNFWKTLATRYVVNYQIEGIKKNTKKIIASAVQEITKDTISRLDLSKQLIKKYVPIVYIEKDIKKNIKNSNLDKMIKSISNYNLVVFSHTRHLWRKEHFLEDYIVKDGLKGLDKLMLGYSRFIKNNPDINPLLVFFEYGSDVLASKELIAELKIEKYVKWLPLMPRKDILQLIDCSDIVVDALGSGMWGGVGWEALASNKNLMQNIRQTDDEYLQEIGHELPFIMKANSAEDVEKHLSDFIGNRSFFYKKAKDNKEWFNKYAGVGLAKDYKDIVEELYHE